MKDIVQRVREFVGKCQADATAADQWMDSETLSFLGGLEARADDIERHRGQLAEINASMDVNCLANADPALRKLYEETKAAIYTAINGLESVVCEMMDGVDRGLARAEAEKTAAAEAMAPPILDARRLPNVVEAVAKVSEATRGLVEAQQYVDRLQEVADGPAAGKPDARVRVSRNGEPADPEGRLLADELPAAKRNLEVWRGEVEALQKALFAATAQGRETIKANLRPTFRAIGELALTHAKAWMKAIEDGKRLALEADLREPIYGLFLCTDGTGDYIAELQRFIEEHQDAPIGDGRFLIGRNPQ